MRNVDGGWWWGGDLADGEQVREWKWRSLGEMGISRAAARR